MTTSVPFDLPPDDPPAEANGASVEDDGRRKRSPPSGGGRGGQQEIRRQPPAAGAPKPPNPALVRAASEDPGDLEAWPRDAFKLWPRIIDHIGKTNPPLQPEEVTISVTRAPLGPSIRGPKDDEAAGYINMGEINGGAVAGFGGMTASDSLRYHLVSQFHSIGPNGSTKGAGPSHYKLEFSYVRNGAPIKTGHVDLDSYSTLVMVRERGEQLAEQIRKAQEIGESGEAGRLPPLGTLPGMPGRVAQTHVSTMSPEMAIEWGKMQAREEMRAEQENRPVREVPPPTGVPNNDAAIAWEREKAQMQLAAEKDKKELELRIRDMEMKQAADAAARERDALLNRLASLEARINSPGESDEAKMLKHLIALGVLQVGPDGKPVPVGAGASYTPPGKAQTPEQQLLEAARVIAEGQKASEQTRETLRKTFNLENPTTEIVKDEPEDKKEPTWFDKVIGVAGGILEGAVKNPEGPLTALATFTKGSQAGQMFEGLAQAAAAGKAAVNASRVSPPSGGAGFKSNA
ncbi:MAG TPA: hypothetical protein VNV25_25540 [Gemmatimonadaceae bacterium]|jgi:hypothetical protein|nr:hypothetical protein [Gemmatimonadaceae bacterium]